jgi:hypothetical protein
MSSSNTTVNKSGTYAALAAGFVFCVGYVVGKIAQGMILGIGVAITLHLLG